jgi:hypothetical protein
MSADDFHVVYLSYCEENPKESLCLLEITFFRNPLVNLLRSGDFDHENAYRISSVV